MIDDEGYFRLTFHDYESRNKDSHNLQGERMARIIFPSDETDDSRRTANDYRGSLVASSAPRETSILLFREVPTMPRDMIQGDDGDNELGGGDGNDVINGFGGNDTLVGRGGDDVLDGGEGRDILYGDFSLIDTVRPGGNDQLVGGAGADFLSGGRGNDTLTGGDGDDILLSGYGLASFSEGRLQVNIDLRFDGGDDIIDGGAGQDQAVLVYKRAAGVTIDISNPNAVSTIYSGGVAAGSIVGVELLSFDGGAGADFVTGGAISDVLWGYGGNDVLHGGGGDDFLLGDVRDVDDDLLDGGDGTDTVSYAFAAASVAVDLRLEGIVQNTGGGGNDTLVGVENLIGSDYSDSLIGDEGANAIADYYKGDDQIFGNGGQDILVIRRNSYPQQATTVAIYGGTGNDSISFDGSLYYDDPRYSDTATLDGGDDNDAIVADGLGVGIISGGSGNDRVTIDTLGGTYTISLGTGSDVLALEGTSGAFRAAGAITVTDFVAGSSGDVVDLSMWIGGGALTNLTVNGGPFNPFASGHLRLLQSGADTLLQADRNGGGDNYMSLLVFQNTTAAAFSSSNFRGPSGELTPNVITMSPTEGADILRGTAEADTISGLGGDDIIEGLGGNDVLDGGADRDILYGDYNSRDLTSPYGNDHLTGSSGNDALVGGLGDDILDGGEGDDTLIGGVGRNIVFVEDRPAVSYTVVDGGNDVYIGGAGYDRAILTYGYLNSGRAAAISFNNSNSEATNIIYAGGVAVGSITGVETIEFYGGTGDDVAAARGYLYGGDGNDTLIATGDFGYLSGGRGSDVLIGGDGDDIIEGDDEGGEGSDLLIGNGGDDELTGSDNNDTLFGGIGTNLLDGRGGTDTASYADALAGITVNLALQGQAQQTGVSIDTLNGIENLVGSIFADTLGGDSGDNSLVGQQGLDTLTGGGGNDYLTGNEDADFLYGNQDDDVLYGNQGADSIYGGQGNDLAYGGQDNDTLFGNLGDDRLYGNLGDDSLNGGVGTNMLDGGDGVDTATYSDAVAGVTVSLALPGQAQQTGISVDILIGIENLTGSAFADVLTGDGAANGLTGGDGSDVLNGGAGADVLYGNQGGDVLYGNQDSDTLYGGQGSDTLYGGQGQDILVGGVGNDTLYGNLGDDLFVFAGGFGRDTIADFAVATGNSDAIQFQAGTFATYDQVKAAMIQDGANVILALDDVNSITLLNATVAGLTADHFLFG